MTEMQRYPAYTRGRLKQTLERLGRRIYTDRHALDDLRISAAVDRIAHAEAQQLEYRPAELGERLGPAWATYWLRARATVPADWRGSRVDLHWVTGTESTLWRGGHPVQGLVSGDYERSTAPLIVSAAGGEGLEFELELACSSYWGAGRPSDPPATLQAAELVRFDPEAWRLFHDLRVLVELEAEHGGGLDESWAGELLNRLNHFCNLWVGDERETWAEAAGVLAPLLEHRNGTRTHALTALGHGHLDTAWLWPLAETWRKCQRTFSTATGSDGRVPRIQVRLLRRPSTTPGSRSASPSSTARSAAADRPAASGCPSAAPGSSRIATCRPASRWCGSSSSASGSSSASFGGRADEFWNPDVFGYNGQLPQIMRGAGIGRFLTQKLSWNRFTSPQFTPSPGRGIDGSRVTHTLPARRHLQLRRLGGRAAPQRPRLQGPRPLRACLLLFGYGDGGGGPTPEMLETLRRVADLQGVPAHPAGHQRRILRRPRERGGRAADGGRRALFEYHRGTYTSQAAVKRGNRRGEALLHDAEFLSAVAARAGALDYPRARR